MHPTKKTAIADLNQHLTCKLCKGYFIDATTIIECLHTFCRSCIVKYLEKNKYCPVCDVQVHKTKPLLNIRPDRTLQDIVYKLVPRLFQNELQRRRMFYACHPESKPNTTEQILENHQHIILPEESVSLTIRYYGCKESVRYLRCPAAVSVGHLQKLIRAKYGLYDNHHVDILYNQDCLNSALTLMDVAYIYSWKRKAPLEFTYRIYQCKKIKLDDETERKETDVKPPPNEEKEAKETSQPPPPNNNNNWKEVQLRISENGEMSIIQDEALELVNNNNYKQEVVTVVDNKKKELPELKFIGKCATTLSDAISVTTSTSCVSLSSSTTTKIVFSTINSSKCSVSSDSDVTAKKPEANRTEEETKTDPVEKGLKRKSETPATTEQPVKQQKQTILNHSIGLHNLSNNHPLKKHSQMNKTEPASDKQPTTDEAVFSKPKVVSNRPGTPKPCYMPKPVINVPKPGTSVAKNDVRTVPAASGAVAPAATNQNKLIRSKASTPIGYKTLRDPPKSWNSQIAKANVNKPPSEQKYGDLKNVRPAKFFKMRNNLPRYLGNPASGVKPMYQVHVSPEKEKAAPENPPPKGEIKKHSIVKIDPKTLKPISEKAPETTSLSNSTADLKINTSSVSIFNPLKLQNSPKERKSPHSPKTTVTGAIAKSSSPPGKRDKLNLNFTPSNPFIPNLASPTISPNQFLYPSGPPGFPSYDPRVMAAYHNLFYGQRMAFPPPPGLGLDLNRAAGKGFEMPATHAPQLKLPPPELQGGPSRTPTVAVTTAAAAAVPKTTPPAAPKKSTKESGSKSEKSLQNAVEKLTQNRAKEIKNETIKTGGSNSVAEKAEVEKKRKEGGDKKEEEKTKKEDKEVKEEMVEKKKIEDNQDISNNKVCEDRNKTESTTTTTKNGESKIGEDKAKTVSESGDNKTVKSDDKKKD